MVQTASGPTSKAQFYGCGTWVGGTSRGWPTRTTDERARGELEEDEEEERLLTRSGMSEYYGSEGFDHPPSDVYSYGGGFFDDVGAARGVSALR